MVFVEVFCFVFVVVVVCSFFFVLVLLLFFVFVLFFSSHQKTSIGIVTYSNRLSVLYFIGGGV